MTNVVPFGKRPSDHPSKAQPTAVDVDGDGIPDLITSPGDEEPVTDLVVRQPDDLAVPRLAEAAARVPETIRATVLARQGDLRPIVPAWMRSRDGFRSSARWWIGLQWHRIRFHLFRSPVYAGRLLTRAPLGFARLVGRTVTWSLDLRADPMEQDLASSGRGDVKGFMAVRKDRAARIRSRVTRLVLVLLLLAAAGAWLVLSAGPGLQAIAIVAAVGVFAQLGSDGRSPLIAPVMIASPKWRELTDVVLLRALKAAGLGGTPAKADKDGNTIEEGTRPTVAGVIARSANGRGYEVNVDLPYGKTIDDAAAVKDKLASGLDVDEIQVFVEAVKGSTRRVGLYIADEDPFQLAPRRSPLSKLPKVSVWDPQPLGAEPRGREARPSLIFNSFLIGAIPRSGKTFAARVLVAPGLLDPYCDVTVLDFKGGKDWKAAEPLAVTFRSGDDDEDLAYALAVLANLKAEAQARFKAFQKMDDSENPEGKLTRELSKVGYRPHLVIIDEVQNLLRASDKTVRTEALNLLIWLAKTGPAAGYTLVMATQRPAADVIPADLRDNTSVRIALRTKTWQSSDAILGSGINAIGFGTSRFLEEHHGAAILGGVSNGRGGDLAAIRTDLVTLADYSAICRAGRQRREDAGTLRGAAAGEADDVQITVTVLEDVMAVWPGSEPKVQAAVLVDRLRELRPDRHANLDQTTLTRALKAHDVGVLQVFRDGANRNGYALAEVRKAATRALDA